MTIKTLPLLTALLLGSAAQATILTVHNDPLYNAQYSSAGAAITAASPFDTLLVHGSATTYGSITVNKPLTMIGPGHDPAVTQRATFSNINITSDSVTLEGLTWSTLSMNHSEVRMLRNRITGYTILNGSSAEVLIAGNVFEGAYLNVSTAAANVEVRNNYFSETSTGGGGIFRDGSATTLVHWNVFARSSTSTSTSNVIFTPSSAFTVLADNVFITATVACFNLADCPNYSFQNNLSYSDAGTLPSMGPNNLDNTPPTWDLGGDYPTFSYTHDHNMLSGAPLTGASDGGQVGVMGGPNPFVSNGLPSLIPRVTSTQLETPYVPVGGSIDVNFQAEQGQP